MWVRINTNPIDVYYIGQIELDKVGASTIFHKSFGDAVPSSNISFVADLDPGDYTLTWSASGNIAAGMAGSGGFDFVMGVPEPSSISLLTLGTIGMLTRRRRTKGDS